MKSFAAIARLVVFASCCIGCADHPVSAAQTQPVTRPAVDPNSPAQLPLEKIQPVPVLSTTRPASTRPAPLEALQLYAQARAALQNNPPQRMTAITLLEKAAALDPGSPEIYEELGRARGGSSDAIRAFEKSLELNPDNLGLHEQLGRQHYIRNRFDDALKHLRLATQTTRYKDDSEAAAVVDFFLASVLHRMGHDRAALNRYELLVQRIEGSSFGYHATRELVRIAEQRELLWSQIAELHTRLGEPDKAVNAYQRALGYAPDHFELNARFAAALVGAGRPQEALNLSAGLVTRFRANSDSLKLLHQLYKSLGRESEVVDALKKLRAQHPEDRSLLFALSDALRRQKRDDEAQTLLRDVARKTGDIEVVKRLFEIHDDRDDVEGAVRLLIETLTRDPDSLRQMSPLWSQLLKPSRRRQLRLGLVQNLKVEPVQERARLFFVSRIAQVWNRDALARTALEQGVARRPAFAPLCRSVVADYWSRPDWDEKQKIDMCQKLADRVRGEGDPGLALEIEALSLLHLPGQAEAAIRKLDQSLKQGNKSPDVQLTQAIAMLSASEGTRAESQLWKVISDWPTYEDAYETLFGYYWSQGQPSRAINVLQKWLEADPGNIQARLLRARVMAQARRPDAAEAELTALFRDDPHNGQVLAVMRGFYLDQNRIARFISLLEEERREHPENREAAEMLVTIYHQQKRPADALRVLDATRDAVRKDPDLLYYIAHVYGRIGQKQTEEDLLGEVLKLDPRHAPAANDLGYSWADEGRNLARAEQLIRIAVEGEPDNQSFLDSLGWVLYKRSKFAEAKVYFEKALGPATRPDPVVLDHMGDVLYRLGEKEAALKNWKWAARRLDERGEGERDDLKKLKKDLETKFRQYDAGEDVTVAPVAEPRPKTRNR